MPASSFSRIQRAPIIPTRTPLRTIHKVERKRGGTGRAEDVAIRITLEGLRRELSRVEGTRVGQWRRHRLKVGLGFGHIVVQT
jgi:hypothetical protein